MKPRLTRAGTLAGFVAMGGILGGLTLTTRAQNPVTVTATPQLTPEQAAQKIAALEKQVADLQAEVARSKTPPAKLDGSQQPMLPTDKNIIFNGKTYRLELLTGKLTGK